MCANTLVYSSLYCNQRTDMHRTSRPCRHQCANISSSLAMFACLCQHGLLVCDCVCFVSAWSACTCCPLRGGQGRGNARTGHLRRKQAAGVSCGTRIAAAACAVQDHYVCLAADGFKLSSHTQWSCNACALAAHVPLPTPPAYNKQTLMLRPMQHLYSNACCLLCASTLPDSTVLSPSLHLQ